MRARPPGEISTPNHCPMNFPIPTRDAFTSNRIETAMLCRFGPNVTGATVVPFGDAPGIGATTRDAHRAQRPTTVLWRVTSGLTGGTSISSVLATSSVGSTGPSQHGHLTGVGCTRSWAEVDPGFRTRG